MTNFIVVDFNVKEYRTSNFEYLERANVESVTAFINRDVLMYTNDIEKHEITKFEKIKLQAYNYGIDLRIVDIDITTAISLHIFACSGSHNNILAERMGFRRNILVIVEDIEKYKNIEKYLEEYTNINITLCDSKSCFERWIEKTK